MVELEGRRVQVTGASSGIGAATVRARTAAGPSVPGARQVVHIVAEPAAVTLHEVALLPTARD